MDSGLRWRRRVGERPELLETLMNSGGAIVIQVRKTCGAPRNFVERRKTFET